MKKIVSALLCVLMVVSLFALAACDGNKDDTKKETLKFGLGVFLDGSSAAATEDANGNVTSIVTAAAVLVDADGKIVKCALDTIETKGTFDTAGKATAPKTPVQSKYEQGDNYNMVAYGGAKAEWYQQADNFCKLVEGKTVGQIAALVAEGNKGTEEVVNAGCTIMIHEFVKAIDAAVKNAADSDATKDSKLSVAFSVEVTAKDATEDADGQLKYETTVVAAALDGSKIIAAESDCVQADQKFGATGGSLSGNFTHISKREQGDNYNMVTYGGAKAEWYAQADAFDAALIGKTAGDVNALLGENGYGNADLQSANCTILVNGLVAAASKLK